MRTIQILILLLFLFLFNYSSFSQGEIDEQKKIFFRNESTFGLLLNSNGFGINYRYGKWENAFNKSVYEIGISTIYHPKEYKSKESSLSKPMKYGKLNNFYVIRAGYGMQKRMFKKIDKGGVSIKSVYSFGPSIGLLKPIYYLYTVDSVIDGKYYDKIVSYPFDNNVSNLNGPYEKDAFTKGLSKTKILPGAFIKFGINFEYSTIDELVHALELGIIIDAFLFEVPIMFEQPAHNIFFTMFIAYRFGKIINPPY